MDIMETMRRTLQEGSLPIQSSACSKAVVNWPAEFRRPIDAALHIGTSSSSTTSSATKLILTGPDFID